jgi:uncharacterized membrane protein
MTTKDLGKTSIGIEANLAALLSYVVGWVTGLIFFLIEKDNKFVRFHAMQSIVVFGALGVVWIAISVLMGIFSAIGLHFMIPLLGGINSLISLLGLVLWIVLMVKAYQGEEFKLPVAGDIAQKNADKK